MSIFERNPGYLRVLQFKNGMSSINASGNISIGTNNTNVIITGTVSKLDAVDTIVKDKLITLNEGGDSTSGFNAGIQIKEDTNSDSAYIKTSMDRSKWLIKAPLDSGDASIYTTAGGPIDGNVSISGTLDVSGVTTITNTLNANLVKQYDSVIPSTPFLLVPTGSIIAFAGLTAPGGWLICDGSTLSRTTYSNLFAVIGTTYGSINGATFNLPNFKGKVPVAYDAAQSEFNSMGETGGEKTHTLTVNEMPSHNHNGSTSSNGDHSHNGSTDTTGSHVHNVQLGEVDDSNFSNVSGQKPPSDGAVINQYYQTEASGSHSHTLTTNTTGSHNHTIDSQGGGLPHNNLQPYIVVQYIIKY